MASVHPVLKASSWRVSILIQTKHRMDRRCPHSDRRIIRCYCLRCSSCASRPTLLENGPRFIQCCLGFHLVYQLVRRLHRCLLSRYRRFIWRSPFFFFFLVFDPWKIDYLLNLASGILASLGPRNVYKDMLNNMVSPIDHVVMNHQNQTRINGKWGHVRYRIQIPPHPIYYKKDWNSTNTSHPLCYKTDSISANRHILRHYRKDSTEIKLAFSSLIFVHGCFHYGCFTSTVFC
jgi:hypothetical protein